MPFRVLIAPDKFKGTLTASQAAEAMARGWRQARPGDALALMPLSDGGDGFGETLGQLLGAQPRITKALNAAHQACTVRWWWDAASKTAIIESARVIGLAMLPPGEFHPFDLDTFGLGKLLQTAASSGAERCIVGIGGSATNDGGFGLARALGWRFLAAGGQSLERWTSLDRVTCILPPKPRRLFKSLTVAVDVQNPLLGPRGATRIYGPQKGLRPEDFAHAERCLRRLSGAASQCIRRNFAQTPGAGAAGGLGFGLATFLGARFKPGFDLIARRGGLARQLARADLVVTGEGAVDRSTLMGKAVGQLAALCQQKSIPCIALAGVVTRSPRVVRRFAQLQALTDLTSGDEARTRAARWLERLAKATARRLPREICGPARRGELRLK